MLQFTSGLELSPVPFANPVERWGDNVRNPKRGIMEEPKKESWRSPVLPFSA